jgi:hypothetical protein
MESLDSITASEMNEYMTEVLATMNHAYEVATYSGMDMELSCFHAIKDEMKKSFGLSERQAQAMYAVWMAGMIYLERRQDDGKKENRN